MTFDRKMLRHILRARGLSGHGLRAAVKLIRRERRLASRERERAAR